MENWRELLGLSSHYRLVATVSWLLGLAADVWFIAHGAPYTFLLSFTALVYVAPYGLKGLTAWLGRAGAPADAAGIASEAAKLIEVRRNGDHEATP